MTYFTMWKNCPLSRNTESNRVVLVVLVKTDRCIESSNMAAPVDLELKKAFTELQAKVIDTQQKVQGLGPGSPEKPAFGHLFVLVYVYVFVWCFLMYVSTSGCQKRTLDPLELELQVFVSHLM
ncbi:prefoldin subunit 1-like protein [Cricetulus griseus]|nr:prefoldin subunit 1-like protein [Cricetulus griseus]